MELFEIYDKSQVQSCLHCGGAHLHDKKLHKLCIKKMLKTHTTIYSEEVIASLHIVDIEDEQKNWGW